jgi:glutaredoxin
VPLDHRIRTKVIGAVTGKGTVPQVFINGRYIGGYEELLVWSKKAA